MKDWNVLDSLYSSQWHGILLNSVFPSLEQGVINDREAIEDDSTLPSIYSSKDTEITQK
ncbi:MAG TPA: hypothetical protein V6C84_24615 [Coleofasciculaceae cyanobacterium]|jgi:hypothetical protein